MCGIVGYLGVDAAPVLLDGLKRLEYRGYDSAGIAVLETGSAHTRLCKSVSKVDGLVAALQGEMPAGKLGIGHTRWATHGKPSLINAHPHLDCRGRIAVVHNGIIENFAELRSELRSRGHIFSSDTDTEVIPHLVEENYHGDLVKAVQQALQRVCGAYAVALYSLDQPDLLIGARAQAPLLLGIGEGEFFLASDLTAIIPHTRRVVVIGDREMVAVTPSGYAIKDVGGRTVAPRLLEVDWDVTQAQKNGHPHFMSKEIHETAAAVSSVLGGRLSEDGQVELEGLDAILDDASAISAVRLLGMGTSLHAAMVGAHLLDSWSNLTALAEDASEFRLRQPRFGRETLTVALTQSGETADTLAALETAAGAGSRTLTITNVVGSTAARDAEATIYLRCGPEIGVASTKTFIAHLVCEALLALRLGAPWRSTARRAALAEGLLCLPGQIRAVLAREEEIALLASRYTESKNFLYIGRGINHPIALEGALKLKEISYRHAEGISAGALKHGPIALLDETFPVVALSTDAATRDKMIGNVHEVVARGAPLLALVCEGDGSLDKVASDVLEIPAADGVGQAVLASVALQMFAYHVASELGCPIDQPRNLAKSVTVE